MNISIIGSGHVGLVTGACLADLGHVVVCVDNDEKKIEKLKRNEMPFYEPGLEDVVRTNVTEGRLSFSHSIIEGTNHGDVIFIAVGTPSKPSGEADLSAIERVSEEIARNMETYKVIVEKSTVPVQTGEWVKKTISGAVRPGVEFDVASVPEFLREGTAIRDSKHPDRVVIGVSSDRAAGILVKIFEPLNAPILLTDIKSAELIKHCANAFLAMKISFINAVSRVCELAGADVEKVAKGIGLDNRIGCQFLQPGAGFGGSCFPKDISAFISISERLGYDFDLLKEVEKINADAGKWILDKLQSALDNDLNNRRIAVLGLAFKPGTDDIRKAPAETIIKSLLEKGAEVRAHDPVANGNMMKVLPQIRYFEDIYETCRDADAALFITEWTQFASIDLSRLKETMKRPIIIDGRNIFEPFRMKNMGFTCIGVGRAAL